MVSLKQTIADNGGVINSFKTLDPYIVKSVTVLVFATLFLGTAPFLEGTSTGWHSSYLNKPTFAEQTHEKQLIAGYLLAFLAVNAIVSVSAGTTDVKPGVTALTGVVASIGLWAVLVVRIASATHASDNIHSQVVVPWFSSLSGVGVAVAPATFAIVPRIANLKK